MPAYTKVLLHMDGPDDSTVFADSAGKVWTTHGNAHVDTAQSKFGGACGYFAGAGGYLSSPNSADFDFGTGNWTIDFWLYLGGDQVATAIVSGCKSAGGKWAVDVRTDEKVMVTWLGADKLLSDAAIPYLAWRHIAAVRNGNTATLYVNGVAQADNDDCTGDTIDSSGEGLVVGRLLTDTDNYYYNGYIDELRISKGIARWTANFTPPTRAYGGGCRFLGMV